MFVRKRPKYASINDKFLLKIAKISLHKQNVPEMRLPNSTFFPCMALHHFYLRESRDILIRPVGNGLLIQRHRVDLAVELNTTRRHLHSGGLTGSLIWRVEVDALHKFHKLLLALSNLGREGAKGVDKDEVHVDVYGGALTQTLVECDPVEGFVAEKRERCEELIIFSAKFSPW